MKKIIACCLQLFFISLAVAQPNVTQRYNLSGTDKDHTVDWEFFCTKGRNSGAWTHIPVPSCWEQQGFGGYNYGLDKTKSDEEGRYRYSFHAPGSWKDHHIFLVFEGSMTDTKVEVNGAAAGPIHQGGFTRFKYDITRLLKPGQDNLLSVTVSKQSADSSVNRAERQGDFWVFGGIYRPVYLEIMPAQYIDRVAIDARADGRLRLDVYMPGPVVETAGAIRAQPTWLQAQVLRTDGTPVGPTFTAALPSNQDSLSLTQSITGIRPWNPESPTLYDVELTLMDSRKQILHRTRQRFGFRTVEVRPHDGIYVNSARVILKGIDHHSEWPETGRTLSPAIDRMDVQLIREMNMNAVRMSHYPPDQSFLEACDSLGLFVLDELTGWQRAYDSVPGARLLREMVLRDVNHPSILFWDNGNEGGWNRGLDDDFDHYDPQHRTVLHPWERFDHFDLKHYPIYSYVANSALYDNDIFMPTEFMHGLYDGGLGAGLEDFWQAMLRHPALGGGFLWAFLDEAVVRTDKNGWLDTDGNHAPDGIVGPHREKEASFYTVKALWSPVQIVSPTSRYLANTRLTLENHYCFTDLDKVAFTWKLVTLPPPHAAAITGHVDVQGRCPQVHLPPGSTGQLTLPLPASWQKSDVLYLTATDPHGKEIYTWSWPLRSPQQVTEKLLSSDKDRSATNLTIEHDKNDLIIRDQHVAWYFDTTSGLLHQVTAGDKTFPLHNGPKQAGVPHELQHFVTYRQGDSYIVSPQYESDSFSVQWTFSPGKPARLDYRYLQKNDADFTGITFDYPDDQLSGMTWTGNGPYRVWKNRLKGGRLSTWHKDYNNTVTGESWTYPEFKGYHSNLYWATIEAKNQSFTVYTATENLFLEMGRPEPPKGAGNNNTSPPFPEGNLGFLNTIPPIGTKFKPAVDMGPQSGRNMMLNYTPVRGTLWFDFRQ